MPETVPHAVLQDDRPTETCDIGISCEISLGKPLQIGQVLFIFASIIWYSGLKRLAKGRPLARTRQDFGDKSLGNGEKG